MAVLTRFNWLIIISFFLIGFCRCKRYDDGGNPNKASNKILNRWELIGIWYNDIYKPATRLDLELGRVKARYWETYIAESKKDGFGYYESLYEDRQGIIHSETNNTWKLSDNGRFLILQSKNHPLQLFDIDSSSTEKKFEILKLKYNKHKHTGEMIYAIKFDKWTYKFVFRPD